MALSFPGLDRLKLSRCAYCNHTITSRSASQNTPRPGHVISEVNEYTWYPVIYIYSGNFPLAQLVERLDTQIEGPWFESLQWRLIYLSHTHMNG